MTDIQNLEILVIGAGMNGGAMACALAQAGFTVGVVERQTPLLEWDASDYDPRVSALTRASQNLLRNLDVWPAMQSERVAAYGAMHVWDAGGDGRIHFDAAEIGEADLGHIVENRVTTKALWQRLLREENVTLIDADSLQSFRREGRRMHVELGFGRQLRCELIIGADGAGSRVRQLAAIGAHGWNYDQHAVVTTVRTEKPHQATAWQRFMPNGPLALLPLDQPHYSSIVWSTHPEHAEELLALPEDAFLQQLTSASEAVLGRALACSRRAAFPLRLSHARDYVAPGLALIGDAAHTIHPLAGQGVNLGFLDVAELSRVLIDARKRRRPLGDQLALRKYERARKTDNLAMQAGMDGFKRLFSNANPLLRGIRDAGMNLTDRAVPLKHQIMRHTLGSRGDAPLLKHRSTP